MRISYWSSDVFSSDLEEAFHWGIIVTIARAAHRGRRTDRGQVVDIGARCVLRSAIRVTDETAVGSLPLGSHHHGRQRQLGPHVIAHCPSNDLAGCKVEHRGQIQPPFTGRDIGNVGRSEEHTSELQSLMRISYAVFCLNKKTKTNK